LGDAHDAVAALGRLALGVHERARHLARAAIVVVARGCARVGAIGVERAAPAVATVAAREERRVARPLRGRDAHVVIVRTAIPLRRARAIALTGVLGRRRATKA